MFPMDVERPLLDEDARDGSSEVMPGLRILLEVASCSENLAEQVRYEENS